MSKHLHTDPMLRRMQDATMAHWRENHSKAIAKATEEQLLRQTYAVAEMAKGEMASWPWMSKEEAESEALKAVWKTNRPEASWFGEETEDEDD